MAIIKDVTVKINNGTATLDAPVQFYEKDHDVELRFKLMDYKYKYDKDPQNILNSVDEDILEAYTTIVNPLGHELEQINGVVKNDIVIFRLDPTYTDELDEIGTYKLQIHIKCTHSEFTIPPITFEVLQRLKGIKVVTDGEDEVDNSEILDNSSKFVSDETGKLLIEWKKGDMISSAKLNAMVDVINDAVDEEKIRQENEIEREKKANNKIQQLENTRVEYINKIDTELDSFADQVDESMSDYETRFNALTVSQQQDAEVIDARDGEQSLKARLDRDIEKAKQVYVDVEGSHISTDSSSGYAKDVEIKGNTIQDAENLADIRSVGDKVEGQELYEIPVVSYGKNLFYGGLESGTYKYDNGVKVPSTTEIRSVHKIKVNPNSNYIISTNKPVGNIGVYYYDSKENFIKAVYDDGQKVVTTKDTHFIAFRFVSLDLDGTVQIEEGTVATPYEPYVEDKLTILSPVQLEKVGDVADRIVCKDGVWGVEKNVKTDLINGSENWTLDTSALKHEDNLFFTSSISISNIINKCMCISNNFLFNNSYSANADKEGIYVTTNGYRIRINKSKLSTQDVAGFKKWLQQNPTILKYQLSEPTFIPLPHDQQIKLRTFANKTNISFLTEIEGTIKAQVPKSLGATVNTHTEQINNLNNELNRVKKLEESTVSTVTTESDFTTVEATSNGYFEDVKLEGKTLVNLCPDLTTNHVSNVLPNSKSFENGGIKFSTKPNAGYSEIYFNFSNGVNVSRDKVYTYIVSVKTTNVKSYDLYYMINGSFIGLTLAGTTNKTFVFKLYGLEGKLKLRFDINGAIDDTQEGIGEFYNILLLEGDHTQNPPEYFEGLKSVGDGVDEISVESVNENLIFSKLEKGAYNPTSSTGEILNEPNFRRVEFKLNKGVYTIQSNSGYGIVTRCFYNNVDTAFNAVNILNVQTDNTLVRVSLRGANSNMPWTFGETTDDIQLMLNKGDIAQPYIPHQSDKKRLLYYNDETQAWEKPILRQWDSIEKHVDGKYYYHQRSGEIVLNGNEFWELRVESDSQDVISFNGSGLTTSSNSLGVVCDKFPTINAFGKDANFENIFIATSIRMQVRILKSKLSTQDIKGFKQWLQANNVTVVYQLAQEKIYECTNIDLITYANETNYVVNSGAIAPRTTLKVMSNISNTVRELQRKVSNLENYIQHVMIDALNNALNE